MKNKRMYSSISVLAVGVLLLWAAAVLNKTSPAWFWVLLCIGILLVLAGIFDIRNTAKGTSAGTEPNQKPLPEYRKKKTLLTPPEKEFYNLLCRVLSKDYFAVLPQIALAAVIDKLTQNSYRNELFRIPDFCIADAKSFEPLLLIELNDASHLRPDRQERDQKVREICAGADLSIVSFTLEDARNEALVVKTLKKLL